MFGYKLEISAKMVFWQSTIYMGGGGGGGGGVLTIFFLVVNVFHKGPYGPLPRSNGTRGVQLLLEGSLYQ